MAIPLTEATLLGTVQGITDVLPISSEGHLTLAQLLFGGHPDTATAAFLHVGTLCATLIILRKRVRGVLVEGLRGVWRPSLLQETQGGRDAVVLAVAAIPTAIVGLGLRSAPLGDSGSPFELGVSFLVSAVAIGSTYWAPKGDRQTLRIPGALLVGLAQGLAVLPGLSRSGMTIATLLWLGLSGERAFELSFLISLPALFAAAGIEARGALHGSHVGLILAYATFIAFVVGVGALVVLRGVLVRRVAYAFAIYLLPLGVATLAWGYARP